MAGQIKGGFDVLPDYRDITRRLGEPLWYDEHGVPRYDPFHPDLCGVYDTYVALLEIACQACGRRFHVAVGVDAGWHMVTTGGKEPELPTRESVGSFDFGDPPRHTCDDGGLCAGETMSSVPLRVIEFWRRDWRRGGLAEWRRDPAHEVRFVD